MSYDANNAPELYCARATRLFASGLFRDDAVCICTERKNAAAWTRESVCLE